MNLTRSACIKHIDLFIPLSIGGNATFPNLLNNFVHVCMYFYYMMSAMGPEYAKFLWWKKYMTELQIVSDIVSIVYQISSSIDLSVTKKTKKNPN